MSQLFQLLVSLTPMLSHFPLIWHFQNDDVNTYEDVNRLFVTNQLRLGLAHDDLEEPWTRQRMLDLIAKLESHPAFRCIEAYHFPATNTALSWWQVTIDVPQRQVYQLRLYCVTIMDLGDRAYLYDAYGNQANTKQSHWIHIPTAIPGEKLKRSKSKRGSETTFPSNGEALRLTNA